MTSPFPSEDFPFERNCPICGREFYPTLEWRYRRGRNKEIYFCLPSCMNKYDRMKEKELAEEYEKVKPVFCEIEDRLRDESGCTSLRHIIELCHKRFPDIVDNNIAEHWRRFREKSPVIQSKHGYKFPSRKRGY